MKAVGDFHIIGATIVSEVGQFALELALLLIGGYLLCMAFYFIMKFFAFLVNAYFHWRCFGRKRESDDPPPFGPLGPPPNGKTGSYY